MYDILIQTSGLHWLCLAALLAGLIYGFAGFGAALVFMPVATIFLDPLVAIAAFSVSAIASLVTVVPGAARVAHRPAVATMVLASWVGVPFGLWFLTSIDIDVARWIVSAVVAATLVVLLSGWRYSGTPGAPAWLGIGGLVGVMGGSTGLNGPALVLFQLGGSDSVAQTRANTILVLTLNSLGMMPLMAMQGLLTQQAIATGLVFFPMYGLGSYVGKRLFSPEHAGAYRKVAYTVIAISAVIGLPIWG